MNRMLRQRCRPSSYRSGLSFRTFCSYDRSPGTAGRRRAWICRSVRTHPPLGSYSLRASSRFGLRTSPTFSFECRRYDSVRRCNLGFATTVSSESCLRRGTTTRAAADLGFRGRCLRRITQVIHYYPPNSKCPSPLLLLLLLLRHRRTNFSPR